MRAKTSKRIGIYLAATLTFSLIGCRVFAESWISPPSTVNPGGPGGPGNNVVCPSGSESNWKTANNDCHGSSWVYYKYHAGNDTSGDVIFHPGRSGSGDTLNNACKETGGFWHLGYDVSHSWNMTCYGNSNDSHWNAAAGEWAQCGGSMSGTRYEGWSKLPFVIDGAAHAQTVFHQKISTNNMAFGYWNVSNNTWSSYGVFGSTALKGASYHPSSGLSHTIYLTKSGKNVNTSSYFTADHYATSLEQVKKAYNNTLNKYIEEHPTEASSFSKWTDGNIPNISAFCSGDDSDQKATFSGTTTLTSHELSSTNGRFKAVFKHNIARVDGDEFEATNKWSTNPSLGTSVKGDWVSKKKGDSLDVTTETIQGYLNYGSSIKVCSSLNYYSEIHSDGTKKSATSSQVCYTFTRGNPSSGGDIAVDVYGDGYNNKIGTTAKRYVLSENGNGEYKIVYHDTAKRTDSVGDEISFSWKTTNTTKTLTAEGVEDKNASGSSGYVGSGGSIVNHHPEVSGVLKYGQTVTFCNNFEWHSQKHKYTSRDYVQTGTTTSNGRTVPTYGYRWVTHEDNYTSINGNKNGGCVEIYRPEKRCAIDTSMKFGIENGENIGRVGVRNFSSPGTSGYSWTAVNSSTSHTVSDFYDKNTWAMPGDSIQFKYEACAGAFYTIETNPSISGLGTHYSTAGYVARDAYGTDATSLGTRIYNKKDSNTDGYLFKDEVNRYRNYSSYKNPVNTTNANLAVITAATPLPYATWTTGFNGANKPASGFLSGSSPNPIAEMSGSGSSAISVPAAKSPSTNNYDGDVTNSYKICKSNGDGCRLLQQDVGGSVTQQFTWNHLVLRDSSVSGSVTTHSASGLVRVPYNYYLKPYVKNDDPDGVVYLGESKVTYPGVVVFPRTNAVVHGGATYATITKETHLNVRVYNQRTGRNLVPTTEITQRLNQNGSLTVVDDSSFMTGGMKFDILDDGYNTVGDKICTELRIWPIDSHETGSSSTVYGATAVNGDNRWQYQYALMEGYKTNASGNAVYTAYATSCSTIAKRPTMSVESSNAYSATAVNNKPGFTTGLYAKWFGGKRYIFGSWSEYGVFGRINVADGRTFVSGAAVGYDENVGGTTRNASRNNNSNTVATGKTSGKVCMFSTQTFVNLVGNDCKSSSAVIGTDAMVNYRDNILDRYGKIGTDKKSEHIKVTKKTSDGKYDLNISQDQISSYRIEKNGDVVNNKSIVGLYANGDAVLTGTPKFADSDNRTIVYNVKGTLIINGNINDELNESKSSISDLTGVIIIAKRVWVTGNVDYINATIVTRDADGAEINTCKTDGGVTITVGTGNEGASRGTMTNHLCNKTLTFDGPVFTRKIILNRTAGASDGGTFPAGVQSIKRAEIFNLNMANYLWSFDQMTHYSQAVTTYSRELPTRY